ncbi:MAG: acyl-CoA dehydrogenase family protein, partial [Pseudomonadota bacterium]
MENKQSDRSRRVARAAELGATVFAERAAAFDRERRYCHENIPLLRDAGLLGMTLPVELGGGGAGYDETCAVIMETAKACTLTARVIVETNMGAVGAIMAYGTPDQRALAAELVLAGDKPAICITEPVAGSAATEMQTVAKKVDGGWRISGTKHWITGGGVSRLHLVFARAEDEAGRALGIGGFIVVADPANETWPDGLCIESHERTLGLCGMPEARLSFDGCFVPDADVLQAPGGFATGFKQLMTAYNAQRVGAAAVALGVADGALQHAKRYLVSREQFGRPIAEFQGLQWMVADMETAVHAGRLMITDAARSRG